jgi:hypothetical protein
MSCKTTLAVLLLVFAAVRCAPAAGGAASPWRESVRLEVARPSGQADYLAAFEGGALTWQARELRARCADGSTPLAAERVLVRPWVEVIRCSGSGRELVGIGEDAAIRWRRGLDVESGKYRLERALIGVAAGALALSDLEVLAPEDGKVIFAGPRNEIPSEKRAVPRFTLTGPILFAAGGFYHFEVESSTLGTSGGLYRLEPRDDFSRSLTLPVEAALFGRYWRAEDFEIDDSGRFLAIAEQWSNRGPSGVRLTVYDLQERRVVAQHELGKGEYCQEPQVVLGPGGELLFTYWNVSQGKQILLSYTYQPSPAGAPPRE